MRTRSPSPAALRVLVAVIALVAFKLVAQIAVGPGWDSFAFLGNAALFAGKGYGYTEIARPPLISVLTAPLLAIGYFHESAIQVVDALLTLAGLAAIYLLARRRFSAALAAGVALAVLIAPPVWEWIGVGYTDFAALGICAWALFFAVKATEDDPRYYLLIGPALVAAALMRVTSLLFVFPVAVWLLLRARPFRHARYVAAGLATMAAAYLPFAAFYQMRVNDALYPFVASLGIQQASDTAGAYAELGSYVSWLPRLAVPARLSALALLIGLAALLGVAHEVRDSLRERGLTARRLTAALAVLGGAALVARSGGLAGGQLAVTGGVWAVWRILGSDEIAAEGGPARVVPADRALDAAMLVWLLGFWWFHEEWAQRVTRYYITMAPAVAYFVALGLRSAVARVIAMNDSAAARDRVRRLAWAPVIAALVCGLALNVAATRFTPDATVVDARKTASWLSGRSDAGGTALYSDMWPVTAWYLRTSATAMPFYDTENAVAHELDKAHAEYYVTLKDYALSSYTTAYDTGTARVLHRTSSPREDLPELLYLGAGWENYLEELSSFRVYLLHAEGYYNREGTAFLDAYPAERLARYGSIAAFGFRWHDRTAAERLIVDYVEGGGTLLLDVSANLAEPQSLADSVLFDTVLHRGSLPRSATITVDPAFAAGHTGLPDSFAASPFVGETGGAWYGAAYSALPGSAPLRVLARVNGEPLVAERRWGRGRVVFVGYNFMWHANASATAEEKALVGAIIDEVTGGAESQRVVSANSPYRGMIGAGSSR